MFLTINDVKHVKGVAVGRKSVHIVTRACYIRNLFESLSKCRCYST